MNTTKVYNYFLTILHVPAIPHNTTTEKPNTDSYRKVRQSQLFLVGLLFMLVVILAVMTVKLYRRVFALCVPLAYPGAIQLQEDDVEEIVVFRNDVEELVVPIYQVEVDAENNVISGEEHQSFKKNK